MDSIDLWEVRFCQDSIKARFRDGRSIEALAEGPRSAKIDPATIPPIRLVEVGGLLYTLDNRWLEAFRRAGIKIPFRMATSDEASKGRRKFSTENSVASAKVRKS